MVAQVQGEATTTEAAMSSLVSSSDIYRDSTLGGGGVQQ